MPPFFDTNILLYAFDEDEPEKQSVSRELIDEHLTRGDGILSVQVLREFYSVSRRESRPLSVEDAVEAVNYFATFALGPEDAETVLGAIRRSREYMLSFWDALIVESALRCGADRLLTEDLQHGQTIEGLRIENPFL
ncbi:MAG: PIN domain-containing protein [Rubrobacteraceae bacterium]